MMRSIYLLFVGALALTLWGCGGGGAAVSAVDPALSQNSFNLSRTLPRNSNLWQQIPDPFRNGGELIRAIVTTPKGDIYVGGSIGVAHSTNNGQSWTVINTGLSNIDIFSLGINALGEPIAGVGVVNNVGAYRYTGGRWRQASGIQASRYISGFTLDKTGAIIAATAWGGDIYRSTDNGDTYTLTASNIGVGFNGAGGALWTVTTSPTGDLYAGGELPGGIYRSTDNGSTWQQFGLDINSGYEGNLYAIAFNQQGQLLAGRPGNGRINDLQSYDGSDWNPSSNGLPPYYYVSNIALGSNGHLFASLFKIGSGHYTGGLYRSIDGGQTWQEYDSGLSFASEGLMAFDSKGYLYVTSGLSSTQRGLYRTVAAP